MNCWLIGVTLQCIGTNDLTFIQNRANHASSYVQYVETTRASLELPKMSEQNQRYVSYMLECRQTKPHEQCWKEHRP